MPVLVPQAALQLITGVAIGPWTGRELVILPAVAGFWANVLHRLELEVEDLSVPEKATSDIDALGGHVRHETTTMIPHRRGHHLQGFGLTLHLGIGERKVSDVLHPGCPLSGLPELLGALLHADACRPGSLPPVVQPARPSPGIRAALYGHDFISGIEAAADARTKHAGYVACTAIPFVARHFGDRVAIWPHIRAGLDTVVLQVVPQVIHQPAIIGHVLACWVLRVQDHVDSAGAGKGQPTHVLVP
mmetsp:Transcript_3340/g.7891  ORF Transcript_3340/g.7891 Transcript_3340/m.7891 type:complete len:246 (+) Transcript_3340:435-1172(+)